MASHHLHYPHDYSQETPDEVLRRFHSAAEGLSAAQVIQNRIHFPVRPLSVDAPLNPALVFAKQFLSPLVLLLAAAAIFSVMVGHAKDVIAISAVLVLNAILGTFFELRTERLTRNLKRKLARKALVRRNGKILEVNPDDLVSGDILVLQPGMQVAADARLLKADFFQTDESMLTGESLPATKSVDVLKYPAPMAEQANMVFAGTYVAGGSADAVVVAVGLDTFQGTIQSETSGSEAPESPLLRRVKSLNRSVTMAAGLLGLLLFGVLLSRGEEFVTALQTAIALIVAMVPEGLPLLLTLTLILGVHALAREHALVKNLAAVDTLASVDTLVADKTGTLTENKLRAAAIFTPHGNTITEHIVESSSSFAAGINHLVTTAVLATEMGAFGNLKHRHDPLETALVAMAETLRSDSVSKLRRTSPHRVLPFNSNYKFMAAFYRHNPRVTTTYLKGAWEVILDRSQYVMDGDRRVKLTDKARAAFRDALERQQALGRKTIAFAAFEFETRPEHGSRKLAEELAFLEELTLVGAASFEDPLRRETKSVIHQLQAEEIHLKVASGDHATVTRSVAQSVGLPIHVLPEHVPVGKASRAQIAKATVFARVSPLDKLKIVKALQQRGRSVAMTGDGANDAPALKQADIGIALHAGGNDIAREAADIILTNNSLRTIGNAIRFGRMLTRNLQRIMLFLITANVTEALLITLATLLFSGGTVLLPAQILWLNLVSDTPLTLPLAFDRHERDANTKVRRSKHGFSLDPREVALLAAGAASLIAGGITLHAIGLHQDWDDAVRQTAILQTLIFGQIWLMLAVRLNGQPVRALVTSFTRPLAWGIVAVLVPVVLFQTLPVLQAVVHTAPLSLSLNLTTLGFSLLVPLTAALSGPILRRA